MRLSRWRPGRWRTSAAVVGLTVVVAAVVPTFSSATTTPTLPTPVPGSAGINPAPPDTSSKMTVNGRGDYSSLAITVNQTQNLHNQTVSVTWTGGDPTTSPPTDGAAPAPFDGIFYTNFLSIFECWGDPQPSDPLTAVNPGPEPTQCEQGAAAINATRAYPTGPTLVSATKSATRIIATPGDDDYDTYKADGGVPASDQGNILFEPFQSVDGTTTDISENTNAIADPNLPFWLNPYFSYNDTNEIPYGRTFANGTGAQLFTADTGLEAPGLGCGQTVQQLANGTKKAPQCWLVVVPETSVSVSPVSPDAWANRIAIPLGFQDLDSPCAFGSTETRIEGSELATSAVTSWQPTLCAQAGTTPYSYTALADGLARADLPNETDGGAQMAVITNPLDPSTLQSDATYAPLTLSALTIAFNIERKPILDTTTGEPNADEEPDATTRVATINLTPRLVAKLLTESYVDEFVGRPARSTDGRTFLLHNASSLFSDPDFQQFNPEFQLLSPAFPSNASQLEVEFNDADANQALWQWIESDAEAAAWLNGQPDQWGMTVNPVYSTSASLNPSGEAFDPGATTKFPKSDPYCEPPTNLKVAGEIVPSPCILNWDPYALDMQVAAQDTSTTNIGSNTTPNANAANADTYFASDGAQTSGERVVMSVTDSASAARYGLQTADLSQDDDDTSARTFVPVDNASILAGEAAMSPSAIVPSVLVPDPSTTAAGAYPLALLTYAATIPATLSPDAAKAYARFVTYGAGPGQVPGTAFGQLPPGYVPLPASLTAADVASVNSILGVAPPGHAVAAPTTTDPSVAVPVIAPQPIVTPPASAVTVRPTLRSRPQQGVAYAPTPVETGLATTAPAASTATPAVTKTTPAMVPAERQALAAVRTPGTSAGGSRWVIIAGLVIAVVAAVVAFGRRPRIGRR